jgi:hypothetical protein
MERRAKLSTFKKELKGAIFDDFTDKTQEAINHGGFPKKYGELIGFYANSLYSVQIYRRNEERVHLLGIRRHDQKPSCPWVHKQKIKNIFSGENSTAIEFFPSEKTLVDQANIYWLWSSVKCKELEREFGGL